MVQFELPNSPFQPASSHYETCLWWVLQVEGVVHFEVHKPHQSCIKLHKSEHHSEIHISRHLAKWRQRDATLSTSTLEGRTLPQLLANLLTELVGSDPGHHLTMNIHLIVDALNGQEHLRRHVITSSFNYFHTDDYTPGRGKIVPRNLI